MAKSKKGDNQEKLAGAEEKAANEPKQSARRKFLKGAGGLVAAAALSPLAKAQSETRDITLNLPLDAEKIAAIQNCLSKGTLSFTISKVDLQTGKVGDPWLYD
jgi:hypothetical protein